MIKFAGWGHETFAFNEFLQLGRHKLNSNTVFYDFEQCGMDNYGMIGPLITGHSGLK